MWQHNIESLIYKLQFIFYLFVHQVSDIYQFYTQSNNLLMTEEEVEMAVQSEFSRGNTITAKHNYLSGHFSISILAAIVLVLFCKVCVV